jgi:putative hydrolase of the HAD superfamily
MVHNAVQGKSKMTFSTDIKLLTLDLDDTLWPCLTTIRRAEDVLYAWLSTRAPRLAHAHDQASLRMHRRAIVLDNASLAHDVTAVRLVSLRALLCEFGYDPDLAREAMALFLEHRNQVEPYPDVLPVLRALSRCYRLVSVTNGNSDVALTPLRGLFHHSLTAAQVGARKPDPALFHGALAWGGLQPREALHLGDDPYLDVQAARDVGMSAVWINRNGRVWPGELEPPIAEVTDLREFQVWLDGVGHGV